MNSQGTAPGPGQVAAPRDEVFRYWSTLHEGFAPLYCASVVREAFAWLAPALGPGRRVLDLGCGTGHATEALASTGSVTIGLDLDLPLLRRSRRARPSRALVTGHAERLPLAEASVDAVYCFSVLQYVDRDRVLAEIFRVLRPSGRFAVVENLRDNPVARAHRAIRALTRAPYSGTFAPRRHPAWSERNAYTQFCPDPRFRAFHLLSPALLFITPFAHAPADAPSGSWKRRGIDVAGRLDLAMLRWVPGAAAAAWLLLATGERP